MESLFARHAPKRGGVLLMLVGSLVVHGGLVGVGALFVQPPVPVIVDWTPEPESAGPEPILIAEQTPQDATDLAPTATLDVVEPSVSTPPPVTESEEFSEPPSPTPRRQAVVRPTTSIRASAIRPTSATTSASSNASVGVPGSSQAVGAAAWVMPHPPYPVTLRGFAAKGATTVRITTDAAGSISNVVVVQSAGNPALDAHTVAYVREHWHGPANASRTTQFVYQLR